MICIHCALFSEAKPLIEIFELKEEANNSLFKIFSSSSTLLIISGIGKERTIAAIGYLEGKFFSKKEKQPHLWVNVGIVGHPKLDIGSPFFVHKSINASNQTSYFPTFILDPKIKTETLTTFDKVQTSYDDSLNNSAFDLEGAAFFSAASIFTSSEWLHSYKIVSDNKNHSIENLTKKKIEELIKNQIEPLKNFIESLSPLLKKQIELQNTPPLYEEVLKQWHFTETQKCQLKKLINKLTITTIHTSTHTQNTHLPSFIPTLSTLKVNKTAKELLAKLQETLDKQILTL